jgi:chromosome partitioning protein
MHVAVAIMKAGQGVATIDLDSRQKSFTHYIENRRAWARHVGRELQIPNHSCVQEEISLGGADDAAAASKGLTDAVAAAADADFIVIDTPGHDAHLMRRAHAMADILITPLNDSFVDFDVLGTIDPASLAVTGNSHYAQMVDEARCQRQLLENVTMDWIVLRNRLSHTNTRNRRLMGEKLAELSQRLNFRCVEGLGERLIFREFFSRGLTALDELDEATLGTRPTMSHVTARLEIENLLNSIRLGIVAPRDAEVGEARDAA